MHEKHLLYVKAKYSGLAGLSAKYLTSGEVSPRDGVELAISSLYAPLAAAMYGATEEEVNRYIEKSKAQFEIYFGLARSRCALNNNNERFSERNQELQSSQELLPQLDEDEDGLIDFDNENLGDDKV